MARNRVRIVIVGALGVVLLVPTLPADAAPRCFGKIATIVGTGRNDRIRGTRGNDVIVGRGGHDLIRSGRGNDRICGSAGDDVLLAGSGKDLLDGGQGADFLAGGPSRDRILGGPGDFNVLRGNEGNDSLLGGDGLDFLLGEEGNDRIDGGGGVFDRVSFFFSPAPVTADLTTGLAVGEGSDTMVNVEDLEGSLHGDVLTGNATENFFFPLAGDDAVNGASGFDLVSFFGAPGPVNANLTTGIATGDGTDTLTLIEDLAGTEHAAGDDLTGDATQNFLFGVEGNDRLFGMEADDYLDGGTEFDSLDGGTHETGDQCVNGEVVNECEIVGTPRSTGKAVSQAPTRLRRLVAPSLGRAP